MSKNKLEEIEKLLNLGWPILPNWSITTSGTCGCGNPNCSSQGKHPVGQLTPNGLKNATIDLDVAKQWLSAYPDMNIGICTGSSSGFLVLDIDPVHGGNESLVELEQTYGALPFTPVVKTGSGGRHYYFKHPSIPIKNSVSKLGAGLDIKTDGGYIIAPPSLHKSGNRYAWISSPDNTPLAEVPDWMLNMLQEKEVVVTTETSIGPAIFQGERNNKLASLAGSMRRPGFSQDAIEQALLIMNHQQCRPPLNENEVRAIAKSISKYAPVEVTKIFPMTDLGNAERLVHYCGQLLRYNHDFGKWLHFDGTRWNPSIGEAMAVLLACHTARNIINEIHLCEDKKGLANWAIRSESERSIKAMLSLAKARSPIVSYQQDYDTDNFLLNCHNGTVNLRNGILQPHTPTDMITKLAPVTCPTKETEAACSLWLRCIDTWMSGDQEAINYLQCLGGMCLTGDTTSRVFPIFWGTGKNGKSCFLDTLMELMGDYATIAPENFLAEKMFDSHPTEIADLAGKRLVIAAETKKNMNLRTSLIKAQTGDTKLKGRFMRQDLFVFTPTHKTILMTQNLPIIDETSDGIWDRVHTMYWKVRIPEHMQDMRLMEKLRQEWSGILSWLIQGCLKWQKIGCLKPTASIQSMNQRYREDEDLLKDFIEQVCIFSPDQYIIKSELRTRYDTWAMNNFVRHTFSERSFNAYMREKGCTEGQKRISGKNHRIWIGVGIQSNPSRV